MTTSDQTHGTPSNVQAQTTSDIGALERKGTYRFLSQLSTKKTRTISVNNRFKTFETIPEVCVVGESLKGDTSARLSGGEDLIEEPPGLNLMDYVRPSRDQRKAKDAKKTWKQKRSMELNCIEKRCKGQCTDMFY